MERRLDRVTIAGTSQATTVVIPWDSRQHLLDRLRRDKDANETVIHAFEAVGTTRPVTLDKAGRRLLLTVCFEWLNEVGSAAMLPAGIVDLLNALEDFETGCRSGVPCAAAADEKTLDWSGKRRSRVFSAFKQDYVRASGPPCASC